MATLSLKKLALRGAVWTFLGYGSSQILRFANNLILTRLLVPEFFGLMAIVNTIRVGLELFSDIGIGQSIIQNKRGDDPVFLNTAWTVQVLRGFGLWLMSLALAYPIASFYGDERLLWLVPIVGVTTIFDGFCSTSIFTLNRRMELGKLTVFELIVQVLFLTIIIVWAYFSPTLLALALGGLSGPFLKMIGSHWLLPGYRNRFAWDRSSLREIGSFGRWIFIATALMFSAEQADRLILGKLLTFQLLGVYTIAYTLANMPREVIKQLSYRVIFPTISNHADLQRSQLRAKILRQRWRLLSGVAVGLAVLISVGDLVIDALYDERYDAAAWMMPILCSGIWFSVLFYTLSPALLAVGKPLYTAQSNFSRLLVISIGLPLAFSSMGILGAVIVIALSDLPSYLTLLYGLKREQLACIAQDIQTTLFFIGVLAIAIAIRVGLGFGLPVNFGVAA